MKMPTVAPVEGRAFSNGTEFYAWIANWCDRCIHDKPARQDRYEDACAILTSCLGGDVTPGEWLPQWDGKGPFPLGDSYHCIEFRDEDAGPPAPTEPEPTPPGQGELLPMEPFVATRMFADVVAEATPSEGVGMIRRPFALAAALASCCWITTLGAAGLVALAIRGDVDSKPSEPLPWPVRWL